MPNTDKQSTPYLLQLLELSSTLSDLASALDLVIIACAALMRASGTKCARSFRESAGFHFGFGSTRNPVTWPVSEN